MSQDSPLVKKHSQAVKTKNQSNKRFNTAPTEEDASISPSKVIPELIELIKQSQENQQTNLTRNNSASGRRSQDQNSSPHRN